LDSRLFGVMRVWDSGFCLADTPHKDDRPPTHFFVKKKFSSIGGAETTTQKVPSVLCYAQTLCGMKRCATHGIPRSGLPPNGGIPASPLVKGRGDRRCAEGAAAVEGFPHGHKAPHPHIPIGSTIPVCAETLCGAGSSPHAGRSFFLYEKSVLRESVFLRGREREICTDLTPHLFRP
jgi:hypothetical protein